MISVRYSSTDACVEIVAGIADGKQTLTPMTQATFDAAQTGLMCMNKVL